MSADKHTAAVSFAMMVMAGLTALIAKGGLGYTLAFFSAVQAYLFVRCTLNHIEAMQAAPRSKAATCIDAASKG